ETLAPERAARVRRPLQSQPRGRSVEALAGRRRARGRRRLPPRQDGRRVDGLPPERAEELPGDDVRRSRRRRGGPLGPERPEEGGRHAAEREARRGLAPVERGWLAGHGTVGRVRGGEEETVRTVLCALLLAGLAGSPPGGERLAFGIEPGSSVAKT